MIDICRSSSLEPLGINVPSYHAVRVARAVAVRVVPCIGGKTVRSRGWSEWERLAPIGKPRVGRHCQGPGCLRSLCFDSRRRRRPSSALRVPVRVVASGGMDGPRHLSALLSGRGTEDYGIEDLQPRLDALDAALRATLEGGGQDSIGYWDGRADDEIDDDPLPELGPAEGYQSAETAGGPALRWLRECAACQPVASHCNAIHFWPKRRKLTRETACLTAQHLLASPSSDEQISETLLVIFGLDRVELVGEALQLRPDIRQELKAQGVLFDGLEATTAERAVPLSRTPTAPPLQQTPRQPYIPGSSLVVETAAAKQAQKQSAKEHRRLARRQRHAPGPNEEGFDLVEWQKLRDEELRRASEAPLFTSEGVSSSFRSECFSG